MKKQKGFAVSEFSTQTDKAISFISENLSINGNVSSKDGIVEILGTVNGDCNVENLTIRESGVINGNISGGFLKIKGVVNGNVSASNIKLFSNAKIFGDIEYTTLSIEDGATLNGVCKRREIK